MKLKALITAGGRGTRLRPITHTLNKHLIPIANQPMISYVLGEIKNIGIRDVVINLNKGDTEIRDVLGDGKKLGLHIDYVEQRLPMGLADVIKTAEPALGSKSKFIFFLGDNILAGGVHKYARAFERNGSNCHLLLARVKHPERFGVAQIKNGKIVRSVEKPQEFISNLAVTGVYFYDRYIFEAVRHVEPSPLTPGRTIREYDIQGAHQWLIDNGYKVTHSEVTGWWKDTGKPEDLLEGNQLVLSVITPLMEGNIGPDAIVQGKVRIGKGTKIMGRSLIRGPVVIGENCTIKDAYIGPFTSIGDYANIEGTEIEHSILFDNVEVRSPERIVDSLIGAHTVITSQKETLPSGHRLVMGSHSTIEL